MYAKGRESIKLQQMVVQHLHKWIYVEEVFNEDVGSDQVSVIFIRSHDFMDSFNRMKDKAISVQNSENQQDLKIMRRRLDKKVKTMNAVLKRQ